MVRLSYLEKEMNMQTELMNKLILNNQMLYDIDGDLFMFRFNNELYVRSSMSIYEKPVFAPLLSNFDKTFYTTEHLINILKIRLFHNLEFVDFDRFRLPIKYVVAAQDYIRVTNNINELITFIKEENVDKFYLYGKEMMVSEYFPDLFV